MKISVKGDPQKIVKRAFYLAWQACGGPLGMGFLQNKPDASEDDVWNNVYRGGDYTGNNMHGNNPSGKMYGDYVFGRMMKVGFQWDKDSITVSDSEPRRDYQAWCRKYPTYESLILAAVKELSA